MVGVPRGTSCRECLQRRVKCDRIRPECLRCQARHMQCPGYHRNLKFYNRTTGENEFKDARSFRLLQQEKKKNNHKNTSSSNGSASRSVQSAALVYRPNMDDNLVPNLAAKALDSQAKEVFYYVVIATFPLTFASFAPRLEPNWVDFIRHHRSAQSEPIERAIRCLNSWYLGVKNKDQEKISSSRYMYGGALRCLAGLIHNPHTRTSDITVATAIMLAVFEMLDGISANSWLVHSRGIAQLIQLRGARAHSSGFARTMFITIRSFFLADAFVRQEASFLEEPEWRNANQEAIAREEQNGKGSWIARITEQVFNEICLGPGLLAQTTALISGGSSLDGVSRDGLIWRIQRSRGILRQHQRQLASVSGMEVKLQEKEKLDHVNGAIPPDLVRSVAKSSLQSISSSLALLDQLLVLLEADKKRALAGPQRLIAENAWGAGQVSLLETKPTIAGSFTDDNRPMDWLDQMAMSMGTLAITNNV